MWCKYANVLVGVTYGLLAPASPSGSGFESFHLRKGKRILYKALS